MMEGKINYMFVMCLSVLCVNYCAKCGTNRDCKSTVNRADKDSKYLPLYLKTLNLFFC